MKIQKIYILLVSSLLAIVTCGVITHYNIKQKKDGTERMMHTHQVLEQMLDLLSTIKDAETGQRGYLLTQDTLYLVSYISAINQIDAKLAILSDLTQDHTEQQRLVNEKLAPLIRIKTSFMTRTVGLLRQGYADSAMAMLDTNLGLMTMNQIRMIGNEITATERKLLQERSEKLDRIYFYNTLTLYGSLCFIGIIVTWSIFTIRKKSKENSYLIEQLHHYNHHLEQEVEKRTQEILEKNQALVHLNEEKNRFLAIAAHDLRSPLSAINGFCHLFHLKGDNLDAEQKQWLDFIASASDRMRHLINNLLDINRIEEGRFTVNLEYVDIVPAVQEATLGYQKIAEQKNIMVQLDTQLSSAEMLTDRLHLLQIMDNLVSNAIKFSPPNSSIDISMWQTEQKICIAVQDEGPGISSEEFSLLFRKFQKLSNAPTGGESSTGLGLYITRELVELLGGEIFCESERHKGTRFVAEFPLSLACEEVAYSYS